MRSGLTPRLAQRALPSTRRSRWSTVRIAALVCLASGLLISTATSSHGREEVGTEQAEGLPRQQRLVLREAFQLVTSVGNELWPGWATMPLTVVIIEDDYEYLMNSPADWRPVGSFERIEQTFLGQPIHRRSRSLPRALRAAFPIGGLPAAVVGAWRPAEESPNEWAMTLVHEWFHVLQMQRDEETKVRELQLGEATYPSLQLDYPFAYGDRDIGHAIHLLGQALYDFWSRSRTLPRVVQRTFIAETSWAALQNLKTVVSLKYGEEAYNYFRYQTWKEGVARYTQVHASLLAANLEDRGRFRQQPAVAALQGSMSYARLWEEVTRTNFWLIRTSVGNQGGDPASFYGIGHGLAELLDSVNPSWKERYFERGIWLDDLIGEAMDPGSMTAR